MKGHCPIEKNSFPVTVFALNNTYKIVVPLFGAAYAATNKDIAILY